MTLIFAVLPSCLIADFISSAAATTTSPCWYWNSVSSGSQCTLKTAGFAGLPLALSTRWRQPRHPASWTEQLTRELSFYSMRTAAIGLPRLTASKPFN